MKKYAIKFHLSTVLFGKIYHTIVLCADNEKHAREKVMHINPNAVIGICKQLPQ
jgi:hypothetical protein